LIEAEHVRAIVEFNFDAVESRRRDAPRLLARHRVRQTPPARVLDLEAQDVLPVVFDRVPAGRPRREREIEARLAYVSHVRRHVKELVFDALDFHRVINA
jgi:hypothetical protein